MNILYDGLVYSVQPAGGINRYFNNLITYLPESIAPSLTLCKPLDTGYTANSRLKKFTNQRLENLPKRLSLLSARLYFRQAIDFQQFDILHPTYYCLLSRQRLNKCKIPVVVTVWDMIHEIFADQIKFSSRHIQMKRQAVLSADAILCISKNTKKDLLEKYLIPEEKVEVTYLASDIDISMSYGSEPTPSKPYYLHVGNRSGYKNFDCLLLAFSKAVSSQPDLLLCVVGPPFDKAEKERISHLKLENNVEHFGYVKDHHLAKLYRCSIALVYPSRYEGFGIPPLEAMSCKTAVIAANCASLPEVVGDAGILFNPDSASDLADILIFLLKNSLERDFLIEKTYKRAKMFSWEKTAAQTTDLYQHIC
ncbi:glycosyltransferase family 1 protein [Sphaerothrix gracilis]|uniref:glycosyltransferase family 4 protein n=1 Tax=Sphaerothrix gracilis TaxID=3151835 RepID=UPI0031FDF83B